MDSIKQAANLSRLEANRAYSAKLSWKRKETLEMRRQIKEFIETNFEIQLPDRFNIFKKYAQTSEQFNFIAEEYGELVRTFYTLGNFGDSLGSLFVDQKGQAEVFTNAHMFSKNRLDPVWNWKKSKLIRSIYYHFLQESKLHEQYNPVHITLTLAHPGGKYNGKDFYAKELIEAYNKVRKTAMWKRYVYAGEYGIEVTSGKNGLHIHAHSLAFLKVNHVNKFRLALQTLWQELTGATQVRVENLYVHKKGPNGQYIMQLTDSSKLRTFEDSDGTYMSEPEEQILIRKKYYIADEKKRINESDLLPEEKEKEILELYTRAILECIKYHFKDDSIKLPDGNYDIFLINEILKNTKNKRLYSRFGKFYKEESLNFNRLENSDDVTLNEANTETVINPHTLEEIPIEQTQIVMFKPEQVHYRGKHSTKANTPYFHVIEDTYEFMAGKSIKQILCLIIQEKFKKKTKPLLT